MKLEEIIEHSLGEVAELVAATDPYSAFEDYDSFKVLLLRRIEFGAEDLRFKSEVFVLKAGEVFHLEREKQSFQKLEKDYLGLVTLLDSYYKKNLRIINAYTDQLEKLEDDLFDRNLSNVFMDMWFNLKRDLSRIENYYYRNGIVYHEFLRSSMPLFGAYTDEFKDIEDSIRFHSSNINTLKSRLDGVHHYHDSIKSDRLNKTLLSLTIISGIFLPLNLIVGFFGMNTTDLFFTNEHHGTRNVLLILGGLLLPACWEFRPSA